MAVAATARCLIVTLERKVSTARRFVQRTGTVALDAGVWRVMMIPW